MHPSYDDSRLDAYAMPKHLFSATIAAFSLTGMATQFNMTAFILKNQHEQFLDKTLQWVDSCGASQLFKHTHRDIALNQLMELNAKDVQLRAKVVTCQLDAKGNPVLPLQQPSA